MRGRGGEIRRGSKVITVTTIQKFIGTSLETKPGVLLSDTTSVAVGSEFFERDTGVTYVYDGTSWNLKVALVRIAGGNDPLRVDENANAPVADKTLHELVNDTNCLLALLCNEHGIPLDKGLSGYLK